MTDPKLVADEIARGVAGPQVRIGGIAIDTEISATDAAYGNAHWGAAFAASLPTPHAADAITSASDAATR